MRLKLFSISHIYFSHFPQFPKQFFNCCNSYKENIYMYVNDYIKKNSFLYLYYYIFQSS